MNKIIITTLDGSTIIYNSFFEYCIGPFTECTSYIFHSYNDIPSYKSDLVEEWRCKGILHRETGPSYIKYYNYDEHFVLSSRRIFFKEYFLSDVRYEEDEFYLELANVDKMDLALQLLDEREWVRERAKSKQKDIKDEKQ